VDPLPKIAAPRRRRQAARPIAGPAKGDLALESRVGDGSIFSLWLPRTTS